MGVLCVSLGKTSRNFPWKTEWEVQHLSELLTWWTWKGLLGI